MKQKQFLKVIVLLVSLLLLSAVLFAVFGLVEHYLDEKHNGETGDEFSFSDSSADQLYYNGQWYVPKGSLETYLLLGVDKMTDDTSYVRAESEQTDFIALLVVDKEQEAYHVLQINRDTMADIPKRDITGKEFGTVKAQLALAHTDGENERERCRNTVKTVESLLYGVDIHHYFSITMDALAVLNDKVGGVEVTLLDDFTDLDEAYEKGAVVTLTGDHALAYVRARQSLADSTNLHRMERQRQYITSLCEKYKAMDEDRLAEIVWDVNEYLSSDCTVDQMSRLSERLKEYDFKGITLLQGAAIQGDPYVEYYLDEELTQKTVIELFYELRK